MEAFSLPCAVDLVTCLYDSLNYLLSEGTLKDAFRCVRRSLNPGGAFIFDMNTEYGLSTYWGDRLVVKDNPGLTSIWRNHYDSRRRIASLRLTLFVPRGSLYARIDEEHRERGYTPREVDSLLAESGFSQRFLYRHRTFDAPDAQTGRVMVVALPGAREASAARRRFWGKSLRSRSRCAAGAAAFRPEGREPSRVERSVRRNEGFGEVRR
jgi:SAM-dependent methyltransferase